MELKRFIINKLILFFMLSTLITVAVSLVGSAFEPEARFGYKTMLTPIAYAALCTLPSLVTYSKRELSPGAMLVRKAIMLVLIEAVMIFVFKSEWKNGADAKLIITVALSVLVIFVLANLFMWLKDSAEAKKLNKELELFQKQHE